MRLYSRSEWRSHRRARRYRIALFLAMAALAGGAVFAFGADAQVTWAVPWR